MILDRQMLLYTKIIIKRGIHLQLGSKIETKSVL